MLRVPRLYLVTDRHATGGRPLPQVIAAALSGLPGSGIDAADVAVQLREKDLGGRDLMDLARPLRALTKAAGVALYINDRADVALAVGADGVHLGGSALAPAALHFAPELPVALSAHSLAQAAAARAAGDRVAFALFGPIRATPSKRAYGPPVGIEALVAAARLGLPMVAIGGLGPEDVAAVLAAGARGVACIRAVMSAADPGRAVRAFCKELTV